MFKKNKKRKADFNEVLRNQKQNMNKGYENFENSLIKVFKYFSSFIDKILFNKAFAPLISLFFAIILFASVNSTSIFTSPLRSSIEIDSVPIELRYNNETFEISGQPENCKIILIGDASNVNNAANNSGKCLINLENYTEGEHKIKLDSIGYGSNVSVRIEPSEAVISLKRKTTNKFDVSYDFINADKLDGKYILQIPSFDTNQVNIRASKDTLNSIAFVKALIDVSDVSASFSKEVNLIAYDKNGEPVRAEINPNKILAEVKVTSPNKRVPIILNTTGEIPNNLVIQEILMDHQSVTIYAPENELSTINYVTVDFDVSTLNRDSNLVLPIILPNNATSSDVTRVNLDIKLAEKTTRTISNVPINYENYDSRFTLSAKNNKSSVDVEVVGALKNIETIKAEDIYVFFDLKDLGEGEHNVRLQIRNNNNSFVSYILKENTIDISLKEN